METMKLFDFELYIDSLRQSEDVNKRKMIETYENAFGEMPEDVCKCEFYTRYLQNFDPVTYKVPDLLETVFDYDLLLKLVAGSFSSDYKITDGELYITAESINDETDEVISVSKVISELWVFQIHRLFEIYLSEQISLINTTIPDDDGETDDEDRDDEDRDDEDRDEGEKGEDNTDNEMGHLVESEPDINPDFDFDSFFYKSDTEQQIQDSSSYEINSFSDYLQLYTDSERTSLESIVLIQQRYKNIINYRIKKMQIADNDIFITNPDQSVKMTREPVQLKLGFADDYIVIKDDIDADETDDTDDYLDRYF